MRRHLSLILLTVSMIAGVVAPAQPALADAITDQQTKAQQALDKKAAAEAQSRADAAAIAQLDSQIAALDVEISAKQADVRAETAKLDAITGRIAQAKLDIAAKQAEEARQEQLLHNRVRSLYKQNGDVNLLDALFSAHTFSELVDRFMVMSDITHSDEVLLQQIQKEKAAVEALKADLDKQQADQAAVTRQKQADTDAVNNKVLQERNLRLQKASDKTNQDDIAAAQAAAYAQASAEIASLLAARGRAHSSGIFAWPGVQGPITQGFGCTDFRGEPPPPQGYSCPPSQPYFHTGIDIAGPYGSEIDAADGGIAYTYPGNSGYGNHVIVVHANGYVTLYGHMSAFAVGDAQGVAKGQRIGYEGSTGFSSGPHLHFEIRLNNQPVNPCNYVGC